MSDDAEIIRTIRHDAESGFRILMKGGSSPPLDTWNVFCMIAYSLDKNSVPFISSDREKAKSFLPRSLSDAPR